MGAYMPFKIAAEVGVVGVYIAHHNGNAVMIRATVMIRFRRYAGTQIYIHGAIAFIMNII